MNLDVIDVRLCYIAGLKLTDVFSQVIPTLPAKWPLKVMSSFLARSFRRTVHARQEGRIVKAISAGQNLDVCICSLHCLNSFPEFLISLQVKDRTWLVLREEGMVVEEALDDDADGGDYDEKNEVIEKLSSAQEKGSAPWTAEPDVASLHIT